MNTLTKNRILQEGDEYFEPKGAKGWTPVPENDYGLQILFTKYKEVRRPSERAWNPETDARFPTLTPDKIVEAVSSGKPFPVPNGSSNESHPAPTRAEVQTSEGVKDGDRTHTVAGKPISKQGSETVTRHAHNVETAGSTPAPAIISPDSGKSVKAAPDAKAERETKSPAPTPSGAGQSPKEIAEEYAKIVFPPFTESEIATAKATLKTSIKINFPPVSAGSGNTVPIWTGRNGTFSGYALEGMAINGMIGLSPIGKRGVGNCTIQFPVSVIPELVDWLNDQHKTPR